MTTKNKVDIKKKKRKREDGFTEGVGFSLFFRLNKWKEDVVIGGIWKIKRDKN